MWLGRASLHRTVFITLEDIVQWFSAFILVQTHVARAVHAIK